MMRYLGWLNIFPHHSTCMITRLHPILLHNSTIIHSLLRSHSYLMKARVLQLLPMMMQMISHDRHDLEGLRIPTHRAVMSYRLSATPILWESLENNSDARVELSFSHLFDPIKTSVTSPEEMGPAAAAISVALVLAAIYCGTNPFDQGAMSGFPGFETYKVELEPASAVPAASDAEDRLKASEILFVDQVQGPESIAFDPSGRGPYTGLADGRIVFWDGEAWKDFAFTSPNRSEICDPKPSSLSYLGTEHICGRPLGLRFGKKTGDLYIADAYFGLLKVGPQGGLASSLTTEAEGIPFKFTNDLDIDEEGNIYFTVSSSKYYRKNFLQAIFTGDPSGRLLKYNPVTKETTVLLRGLQFPNGVSLSKDGSFFVFCESARSRLTKYWLKGEKAGTSELFAILPGAPDNVRTNEKGEFWVAIHSRRTGFTHFFAVHPNVRKIFLKLPIPAKYQYLFHIGGRLHALIMKYGPDGQLLKVLEDKQGKVVRAVSEVEERDGKLWIGSVLMPFIAVYADVD